MNKFGDGSEMMMFAVDAGSRSIVLNWDDWQNRDQDFNLYVYDKNENLVATSENIQNGYGTEPIEYVRLVIPEATAYYAAFYAALAYKRVTFDLHVPGAIKYPVPEYSITNPAVANLSLTVGAVNWQNDALEDFSSRGPTADDRFKPELSAPDRVSSIAYGDEFPGTSAACPHVAGAAALVWQAYPNSTTRQVTEFLESRAIDLGTSGPDYAYGYGRLSLGDPPGAISLPTSTQESGFIPPGNTATAPSSGAIPVTPTLRYTTTPVSEEDETESNVRLGILICIAAPGLIGLGGIGLLGVVWRNNRSRRVKHSSQAYHFAPPNYGVVPRITPVPPPISPPAAVPQPCVGQKAEGRGVCPRCGMSHQSQALFCSTCGMVLPSDMHTQKATEYCIYCGKPLIPNSKFCYKCGKPVKK